MLRRVLVLGLACLLAAGCSADDGSTTTESGGASDDGGAALGNTPPECVPLAIDQLAFEVTDGGAVDVECDLAYKTSASGLDQAVAVYTPADAGEDEPLPAVIFFHTNGRKDQPVPDDGERAIKLDWMWALDTHARNVASLGAVGITFNYSTYPMVSDFAAPSEEAVGRAAQDAADLLGFVVENAQEFQVDTNRICVWTSGTGALIGAYTALAGDPQPVCAVIFTGALDMPFAGTYNPVGLVSADMPPFFIARGSGDLSNNDGIDSFVSAANGVGGDVTLERVNAGYSFEIEQPDLAETSTTIQKALDFVLGHLGLS